MKTVAIITEYNPFHYGHLYQLDEIRRLYPEGVRIIAVMSGNLTQRGEIAVADKSIRAKAAVDAGVDLVLELPFPYSSSSAEFFARAGAWIAHSIGVVDALVFGSESGDINELILAAEAMRSSEYLSELSSLTSSQDNAELGYPRLCEMALSSVLGRECKAFFDPNNILAIEYIKALHSFDSNIEPITIKRVSAEYTAKDLGSGNIQSATALRPLFSSDPNSALSYIPSGAREVYSEALKNGRAPLDMARLDTALISFLRLNSPEQIRDIHDASGGLYNRLHNISFEANSISALMQKAETKRYTNARIRRAIWNAFLGVTSSEVRSLPAYTQVLAMSSVGRVLLKEIKRKSNIAVITKPASYKDMGDAVIHGRELADKADSILALAESEAISGRFSLTFTPYVKKD